jgi:hypothetical protein
MFENQCEKHETDWFWGFLQKMHSARAGRKAVFDVLGGVWRKTMQ